MKRFNSKNRLVKGSRFCLSIISFTAISLCSVLTINAQNSRIEIKKNLNYRQNVTPTVLDNYLYSTFYSTNKKCYNLKGFEIAHSSMKIESLKMNPSGYYYAVLSSNGKQSKVEIFNALETDKKIYEFNNIINPTAIAFSNDSRRFFIASGNTLHIFNAKTFVLEKSIQLPFTPRQIEVSGNNYYTAISDNSNVAIIDIENGAIRSEIPTFGNVKHICFSEDSQLFGVLTDCITIYDTRSFASQVKLDIAGNPTYFTFHPEGKYVSVVSSDQMITFINIVDTEDRPILTDPDGMISYVKFVKDGKRNIYLSYNSNKAIKYKLLGGFSPNYTKMLRDELLSKMDEWSKMRDGESMEDYKLRVNEDTRIRQAQLFEQEIATRMADDMVMSSNVTLGSYNPDNSMLTLNFDNLPTVYLTVPENEVQDFMNADNLEFRDAVYGITKNDKFELIYANVYNKSTGKQYTFNNLDRQSLDFLSADDSFVPIELVQQSSMEEVKLNSIKRNVVDNAMKQNLISDHTNIEVSTGVESDYDAQGSRITNYKVRFNYTVDSQYSAYEDFAAGKYKINESNAAESMLKIVAQAFEKDFAQYIQSGKKVRINITGSADALPITGTIGYDGSYGDFENEPYYLDGNLSNITVTKAGGIKKNEQLAFIRAAAVKDYIQKNLTTLNQMNTDYVYNIELSDKKGGEFRRIGVEFTFINAF